MRARVAVHFMPETNMERLLTNHFLRARKSIHILMYQLTHPDITRALSIAQNKHHIEVKVILDAGAANELSEINELIKEGIKVKISSGWGKLHHKNCVIDSRIVLLGSANYSKVSDTRNCEDLVLISSKKVGRIFEARFSYLWERSVFKK
ncbi:MAG: phospholipase D-like domain-containing protein [bacterium]